MYALRRAEARGHADHGWLNSYHTFSFGGYYDPRHMGFANLRVINDDTVAPGAGFGTHGHSDMEIISYVLDGALEHKDSMGNGSVIRPGDIQRMSAGSGVTHSEYNPAPEAAVHFLQIWLQPNALGVEPSYQQKYFSPDDRRGRLQLLVSPDGREESISSHQDGLVYGTLLDAQGLLQHKLEAGRRAYVHVARGRAKVNGETLDGGDGVAIENQQKLSFEGVSSAEILVFDLP